MNLTSRNRLKLFQIEARFKDGPSRVPWTLNEQSGNYNNINPPVKMA
ncbi:hypothetical protein GGD83_002470 [Rhodoblastus sphagnicola]|nr:hypothetical protein [Rhodoblastus sphagnicola]